MKISNVVDAFTKSSFDNHIVHSARPVVVIFYREDCDRSLRALKTMRKIALDFHDFFTFMKVALENEHIPDLNYEIYEVPTIMIYYRGCISKKITGDISYEKITSELANLGCSDFFTECSSSYSYYNN